MYKFHASFQKNKRKEKRRSRVRASREEDEDEDEEEGACQKCCISGNDVVDERGGFISGTREEKGGEF